MTSRVSIILCLFVLLAGCSIPTGLSGNDSDSDEITPIAEPTPLPTQTPQSQRSTPTSTGQQPAVATSGGDLSAFEQKFIERVYAEINQSRAARGLTGLDSDRQLQRGGMITAETIADDQYFTRNRSGNTTSPNASSINVYQALTDNNITCAQSDNGGVYAAKLYYQQYVNMSNEFVYYNTPSELADGFLLEITTTRSGSSDARIENLLYSSTRTRHGVGIYRDDRDIVYVLYLSCE